MRKGKELGLFVLLFFAHLVLTFFFVDSLLICINNFVEVSVKAWFWCCVGIAIVSAVITVVTVKNARQFQETRFSFWVGKIATNCC